MVYTSSSLRAFYLEQMELGLVSRAAMLLPQANTILATQDPAVVDAWCKRIGNAADTRITIVRSDGLVLGDTDESPPVMDNHGLRPEIVDAFQDGTGSSLRFSDTLQREMMYVAKRIGNADDPDGIVRVSVPVTSLEERLWTIYWDIAVGGTLIATVAALVSWMVSRRLMRPIDELKKGAERFSSGQFDAPFPIPEFEEIAGLAEAMNQMAEQLDERIRTTTQQRNEQEAVLSSMVESVIAVDKHERIISMNQAAGRMLGLDAADVTGRPLRETVDNSALHQLFTKALTTSAPVESEFVLQRDTSLVIQAHGTVLRDASGEGIGAVGVLNDITALRRLEDVRRDFVANVSHELKTPITSIKGFVETLLDGALESPDDARRFLAIIAKQADRLNAIIEDLLTLSRIEQEEEKAENILGRGSVSEVIDAAVQLCRNAAETKDIAFEVSCPEDIQAMINPTLLEQGIVNLVDNAVKYSEAGSRVRIEAGERNGEVQIRVIDEGVGIAPEQLPRLFERFYRVDKARSRSLGGTGLGLAIVKHIAQAHGGRISVDSELGKGSRFSLHLRRA